MTERSRNQELRALLVILVACAAAQLQARPLPAGAPAGYHLQRELPMAEVTGWDELAIDAAARRLFISNNSGLVVFDIDTLQRVGTVPQPPNFKGVGLVHGVAIAAVLGRGFISHELPPSVYAFDLKSLAPLGVTPTDSGTDAIVYDPASQRVFTFNSKHRGVHDATAVDAVSGRLLAAIPLPGSPESAVADGSGKLYVNIESLSALVEIDARLLKVTRQWPLSPCKGPGGLAMDIAHRRLFAACDNQIMVMIDAESGKVLAQQPTGDGTDAVSFDPGTGLAFASNGAGTLTVLHEDSPYKLSLVQNVTTAPGARTMALDPMTHRVFLVAGQFGAAGARPTADNPHGYPTARPGSVRLLVFGP